MHLLILFVCLQEVPAKSKDSPGGPWQFVGLLPLFDPPRHDSAETIRRALNLGVNVKMITGVSFIKKKRIIFSSNKLFAEKCCHLLVCLLNVS